MEAALGVTCLVILVFVVVFSWRDLERRGLSRRYRTVMAVLSFLGPLGMIAVVMFAVGHKRPVLAANESA